MKNLGTLANVRAMKRAQSKLRTLDLVVAAAAANLRQFLHTAYKTGSTQTLFEVFQTDLSDLRWSELRRIGAIPPFIALDMLAFDPTKPGVTGFYCTVRSADLTRPEIDWPYLEEAAALFGFIVPNHNAPWRIEWKEKEKGA